jgi:hypothetical protein
MPENGEIQLFLLPRLLQTELGRCNRRTCLFRCVEADKYPQIEHKKIHKSQSSILHHVITPKIISKPDPDTGHYDPFPTFPYTGPLRAVYPLSTTRKVPSHVKLPDYAHDGIPRSEQKFTVRNKIAILDKKGQDAMRKVCRMGREILDIAAAEIKPGVTTDYIDEVVHKATIERNVRGVNFKLKISDSFSSGISISSQLQQLPKISVYIGK